MNQPPPKRTPNIMQHVGAGLSLAGSVLFCVWVGHWVDGKWHVSPWGLLVGAFVGIGAGLYNFIREFSDDDKGN